MECWSVGVMDSYNSNTPSLPCSTTSAKEYLPERENLMAFRIFDRTIRKIGV
jgi:hypothetical protein